MRLLIAGLLVRLGLFFGSARIHRELLGHLVELPLEVQVDAVNVDTEEIVRLVLEDEGCGIEFGYRGNGHSYFDDALFIGDSRTEGLALYGNLSNADYFTSVGMSIFKVTEKSAGNPNLGESCTLSQKLAQKQYGKVYIMLGLNELGTGTTESWSQTYADVIAQVRQAQPNAIIYLQSILVVSASQNDPSSAINNDAVNTRNAALEALANPQNNIYYLNVNEAVMDANGCLDASLTSDGIHLLGNSLSLWEDYLKQHAINSNGTAGMSTAPTSSTTYTTAVPTAPLSE